MRKQGLIFAGAAALVVLSGCEKAEAPAPTDTTTTEVPVETASPEGAEAAATHRYAAWAGKWTGVEGMYLTITPGELGKYKLEMQAGTDDSTKGSYDGADSEHGIQFKRGGEQLSLHRGNGDDTGLKYLAGKKECLIVKSGEGYCRD